MGKLEGGKTNISPANIQPATELMRAEATAADEVMVKLRGEWGVHMRCGIKDRDRVVRLITEAEAMAEALADLWEAWPLAGIDIDHCRCAGDSGGLCVRCQAYRLNKRIQGHVAS